MRQAKERGRAYLIKGEECWNAKLTWALVEEMRTRWAVRDTVSVTQAQMCREYEVDAGSMSRILNNQRWKVG